MHAYAHAVLDVSYTSLLQHRVHANFMINISSIPEFFQLAMTCGAFLQAAMLYSLHKFSGD
jgi:hypothetical protein